jgi:hypothetical protein
MQVGVGMGGPPMFAGGARPSGPNPYGAAPVAAIDPSLSGLPAGAQRVMQIVRKSPDTNEGVNVYTIVNALRGQGMGEQEVRENLQYLTDEVG